MPFLFVLALATMENTEMAVRIIDKDGLKARGIDINDSTIWRKAKAGQFPKAIKIGNRRGWVEAEVDAYLEDLIAKRDTAA
jgi:predicted DNA-binding transcriptional regulator AlpA